MFSQSTVRVTWPIIPSTQTRTIVMYRLLRVVVVLARDKNVQIVPRTDKKSHKEQYKPACKWSPFKTRIWRGMWKKRLTKTNCVHRYQWQLCAVWQVISAAEHWPCRRRSWSCAGCCGSTVDSLTSTHNSGSVARLFGSTFYTLDRDWAQPGIEVKMEWKGRHRRSNSPLCKNRLPINQFGIVALISEKMELSGGR